jgi:hypothetical protein
MTNDDDEKTTNLKWNLPFTKCIAMEHVVLVPCLAPVAKIQQTMDHLT